MAKSSARSSKRGTRRRRLTVSVESVVERLEAIQMEAKERLNRAGNLEPAMTEGIAALSQAIDSFREAGLVAEELHTLCRIVDDRGAGTQAQVADAANQHRAGESNDSAT